MLEKRRVCGLFWLDLSQTTRKAYFPATFPKLRQGEFAGKGKSCLELRLQWHFLQSTTKDADCWLKQPLGSLRTPEARAGKLLTWHLEGHGDIAINTLDFGGKKFYENIPCKKKKKVEVALNWESDMTLSPIFVPVGHHPRSSVWFLNTSSRKRLYYKYTLTDPI